MPDRIILPCVSVLVLLTHAPTPSRAQDADDALPSIASFTERFQRMDGFLPLYWDERKGHLWLEIPFLNRELLYVHSLPGGLGSNDVGLDRGQLGEQKLVYFQRVGPKVLLVQPNYRFRAETDNAAERRAVADAFAQSVLWGFEISAESEDRILVDATEFALRDAHGVVRSLKAAGQGDFSVDQSRSALDLPRTKAFPKNSEIEVTLTFSSSAPGAWVSEVTPTPEAVTLRQRHSFIELPGPGYEVRWAHPGAGSATFFGTRYVDYSAPLGEPNVKRFVARHRLSKKDPAAAVSEPVEPIVYYVDPGVPEPVRSALVDGASWWNEAFEAAGYRDAFRVELLPEDADPLDVRYNVIQWVHRSTRGWSYGGGVVDPRTGEIIKGHVTLGSLRVRHDYLLAEGLLSPYEHGSERPPELAEMALSRIRQLSAHEVGHTLGLAHNYISSAQGPAGRASVMDYPHPLAVLGEDGSIDLSQAYDDGIGAWDKIAIRYAYEQFPYGTDEEAALRSILEEGRREGLTFLTDADARPQGGVHPQAHLWDLGTDAAAELRRVMEVRRAALARFGPAAIPAGMPMATLEEVFVPLYLHHRYQIEAVAKVVAGRYYTISLRGDDQEPIRLVPGPEQLGALDALLETLDPSQLAIPDRILGFIPPRPPGYPAHRELFERRTGPAFDAITPAVMIAELTIGLLLHQERAARLVEQAAIQANHPGLSDVLDRLISRTFDASTSDPYLAELNRAVQRVVVERLMALAASAPMPQVRAITSLKLEDLRLRRSVAEPAGSGSEAQRAHSRMLIREIDRFLTEPEAFRERVAPVQMPPGSPIGSGYAEPACSW